jgi:hypothetical protein
MCIKYYEVPTLQNVGTAREKLKVIPLLQRNRHEVHFSIWYNQTVPQIIEVTTCNKLLYVLKVTTLARNIFLPRHLPKYT